MLKKNLFRFLLNIVWNTLFKKGTAAMGQKTLNRIRTSGIYSPKAMGVSGCKITKRKHQG